MRINSLQVHPTPMWTSTLRGCLATPVSHCVKLKHNHPRQPSPSYEPGNPPPLAPSVRHSFHFLLSISLPPPLFIGLLSFSLFLFRAVGYLYSHPYRPFQSLATFFHPSPTFPIFVIFSPLFPFFPLFFFFSFVYSVFFFFFFCLLSFFFFFLYIYFFFLYDFS